MRTRALLELAVAVLLLGACVPPPPLPPAPPAAPLPAPTATSVATRLADTAGPRLQATSTVAAAAPRASTTGQASPAPGAVPADWQTYNNVEVGFSIRYPAGWTETQVSTDEYAQSVAVEGSAGRVEMTWGEGFGFGCQPAMAIHLAQGQVYGCYGVEPDGLRHWNLVPKELPTATFAARASTKDGKSASAELVLAVLATLTFGETPAGLRTPAPTPPLAPGMEVVIDNADASFWPKGNWYGLFGTEHAYGADCYQAWPGLQAAGVVRPDLPSGAYEVFARWCGDPYHNQSIHGVIDVHRSAGDIAPQAVGVNYQTKAGQWQSLGTYNLEPGAYLSVKSVLDGSAVADAFRFVYRSPAAPEAVPTPLPSVPIVSNHPPTPLQQLTSGDLAARLTLVDPFYVSAPMTATLHTFDDCRAFPREGCGGTREGWQAIVAYQAMTLTYRVSSDYKLVGIEGADKWFTPGLMGEYRQLLFLRVSAGGRYYRVYYYPDKTWHVLGSAAGTEPASDVVLPMALGAQITTLAEKYSTIYLRQPEGDTLVLYGVGPTVAPTDADKEALLALGATLVAGGP